MNRVSSDYSDRDGLPSLSDQPVVERRKKREAAAGDRNDEGGVEAGLRHAAAGHPMEKPRDVRGRGGRLPDPAVYHPVGIGRKHEPGVHGLFHRPRRMAFPDRALCELRDRPGRSPRQGPGPIAEEGAPRHDGLSPEQGRAPSKRFLRRISKPGDTVVVEAGQTIPGDGEIIEGVGVRRRVGDYRRVGARHPCSGRRPVGRHRRHRRALRPHRRPDHERRRGVLPRPDDRPRGRRHPPEQPQRDRPYAASLGLHPGLPHRGRSPFGPWHGTRNST